MAPSRDDSDAVAGRGTRAYGLLSSSAGTRSAYCTAHALVAAVVSIGPFGGLEAGDEPRGALLVLRLLLLPVLVLPRTDPREDERGDRRERRA